MACGCQGGARVGSGTGMMQSTHMVYRILRPGSDDPRDCIVRDPSDLGSCRNFPTTTEANSYITANHVDGVSIGVLVGV